MKKSDVAAIVRGLKLARPYSQPQNVVWACCVEFIAEEIAKEHPRFHMGKFKAQCEGREAIEV